MDFEIRDYSTMQKCISEFCRLLDEAAVSKDCAFDCRLVVNELIGNVLRHAQAAAQLRGRIDEGFIEIVVCSSSAFIPPKKSSCSDVYAEHGRGLYLVDSVCTDRITTPDGSILVRIKRR